MQGDYRRNNLLVFKSSHDDQNVFVLGINQDKKLYLRIFGSNNIWTNSALIPGEWSNIEVDVYTFQGNSRLTCTHDKFLQKDTILDVVPEEYFGVDVYATKGDVVFGKIQEFKFQETNGR